MADERRYDERELGQILERVAELHTREGGSTDARALTRAEIEQVVDELGISKALVARAVSELAVEDVRNKPVWWLGGKTDVLFEHTIDGRVDDALLARMIDVLRRQLGDPGELRTDAGARIWSTTANTSRRIYFTVVEDGNSTTLRLEERMPNDASATVMVSAFAGGMGGFSMVVPLKVLLGKVLMMLAWGPAILVGVTTGWLIGRAIWKRSAGDREGQLQRSFEEIVRLADAAEA